MTILSKTNIMKIKFNNGWEIDAEDVTETDEYIRGYVLDGCYWMDYNKVNKTFSTCFRTYVPGHEGSVALSIDWTKPSVVHEDVILL